ncbi:hypothetical protein [Streptomyces phaeochromogenes]|uniref:hypothetical protein n=1 Tax=Streptomyces phaeochromogenes TaxID=1923 RepID=UPI002DDBF78E|nr:hypothetical protein [Streptomyces phaeochromogenes]WRZ34709.1 hypothetical protein OG931_46730 [Streptomyces phaeochromogenes]
MSASNLGQGCALNGAQLVIRGWRGGPAASPGLGGQRGQLARGPSAEIGRGTGEEGELLQPHGRLRQLVALIEPFVLDCFDGGLDGGGQPLRGGGVRIAGRVGGVQEEVERVVVLGVLIGQVVEAFDGRWRWRHLEQQGVGGRCGHARERWRGTGAEDVGGVAASFGSCGSAVCGVDPKESRTAATSTRCRVQASACWFVAGWVMARSVTWGSLLPHSRQQRWSGFQSSGTSWICGMGGFQVG